LHRFSCSTPPAANHQFTSMGESLGANTIINLDDASPQNSNQLHFRYEKEATPACPNDYKTSPYIWKRVVFSTKAMPIKHKEGELGMAPDVQIVEEGDGQGIDTFDKKDSKDKYDCISVVLSKRDKDVECLEDIDNKKQRIETPPHNSEECKYIDSDEYSTPCGLRPGIDWDGNAQCGCPICMGEEGY
jgi:hypothetical protein